MSRLSIAEILVQVASTVNQEAIAPTNGSAEYNLWLQYINRGVFEWANANDWEALRRRFYPSITGTTQATVALPGDFKKLAGYPVLYDGSIERGVEFPEILNEQSGVYNTTDKYFTQTGDMSSGFALVFHPGVLASGASLQIEYFCMPTSLASPAQYPIVPDDQFLVDRTIAYIFEARADARFQTEEVKARERLLGMIENADLAKYNSFSGPNFVQSNSQKQGFRIGRDG